MTGLRARAALFLRWTADRLSGEDPVAQLTEHVTVLSAAARDRHPSTSGSSWFGPSHPCRCAFPDDPDHLPPGGTW